MDLDQEGGTHTPPTFELWLRTADGRRAFDALAASTAAPPTPAQVRSALEDAWIAGRLSKQGGPKVARFSD